MKHDTCPDCGARGRIIDALQSVTKRDGENYADFVRPARPRRSGFGGITAARASGAPDFPTTSRHQWGLRTVPNRATAAQSVGAKIVPEVIAPSMGESMI
jgi:hypothetical protein